MGVFTAREREILTRLAEAVIPRGERLPAGDAGTVERLEAYVGAMPPLAGHATRATIWGLEAAAVAFAGGRFSRLELATRERLVASWETTPVAALRHGLRTLFGALRSVHVATPEMFAVLGVGPYGVTPPAPEAHRWRAQITDGREVTEDATLEVDVVVVGTGAGGAPVAYELALKGHAVLMLEEGPYVDRSEFNGRPAEMTRKLYRDAGLTVALGTPPIPVWLGRVVGGTTVINSGTCYRTPERTFRTWREQFGLGMFSGAEMDRYYRRVEKIIGVELAREEYLGGVGRVVARGAAKLGYAHGPLPRNAPDCDGQGVCCFGCPTGAKRSTNVSYVPMALERGAALFAGARVERILVERGAARGVVARCAGGGTLTVRARMTVVACGTVMTPVLLLANGLANASGMVGRNLSIHPAAGVLARFDETIEMHRAIPQGYAIEQFADEGLMLEGGSTTPDITAIALPFSGPRFTELMEAYNQLATFGFMIQDTSRGRVLRGPGGRPVILYGLNETDTRALKRGIEAIADVFFAAGARRVYPPVHGFTDLRSPGDMARLRAHRYRPGDMDLSAYHPLGTARMGTDPRTSVVGADHQAHDVRDLYVVDGSVVPSSLGANPQLTIMAMATRAAEIMDARLTGTVAPRAVPPFAPPAGAVQSAV